MLTADYSFQTDESFTFDAAGNRTMTGYAVGDNNQTLSDGIYSYTYDAEGNRLTRTHLTSGAVVQYSWDYRNRLVGIVERNAQQEVVETVTYRYDPLNRRMAKEVAPAFGPSTVEHFLYDAGSGAIDGDQQIAWQFQSGGTVTHRYLHGPAVDQVLADEQVGGSTAQVLYPLADQLGSVRDLADYDEQLGITQIAQHLVYDAFGRIQMAIPSTPSHLFGYTGREFDTESGLSYYRARYYDAALGQFLNEDPLGFDARDANLRRYVGNGPLDAVDPSGMQEPLQRSTIDCHQPPASSMGTNFDLSLSLSSRKHDTMEDPINYTDPSGMCSQGLSYTQPYSYSFPNPVSGLGLLNAASLDTSVFLNNSVSLKPIAPESITIGSWLPGVSSDAYLHLTPASSEELASGIWKGSSWSKLGDVASLTVPDYKADVVALRAAAYGPGATNFAVVSPSEVGYASIKAVEVPNVANVQEYVNMARVTPGQIVEVPRMPATGAGSLAAEAKGLSSLGAAARGGMSNAEAVVVAARGIEAVANVGVAFWAEDMDRQFVKQSAAGLNNLLSQIAVNDNPSAGDVKEIQQRISGLRNYSRGFWGWAATIVTLGDASYKEQQSMAIDRYTSELAQKYGYEASYSYGMKGLILTRTDTYSKKGSGK